MSVAGVPRAVVFAYHDVGVRCLEVLHAHGVEIPLVVTHRDNPKENVWFGSVAGRAAELGIEAITPEDPNTYGLVARLTAMRPEFLFSFYYRHMLSPPLLDVPTRGALNMHGSLLPKYRGRAPVNWAVIRGERETGATLHYMVEKPDAGDIVGQTPVSILPDETAREVFDKVTAAAGATLDRWLPALIDGSAGRIPQDLARGSYFGARTPKDGTIDWNADAKTIHDLVRGVAPPYPGARTEINGEPSRILRTRIIEASGADQDPALSVERGRIVARCGGGGRLNVLELEISGRRIEADQPASRSATGPLRLGGRT
jgi:methionyl-tRNA formyltransferase